MRDNLRNLGPLGPLAFILAFTLVQPLGPSGHLFVLAASLVWSAPQAFALSVAGGVLGHSAFFLLYRYVLHDWARARLPDTRSGRLRMPARLERLSARMPAGIRRLASRVPDYVAQLDQALERRPFWAVLVIRLLTFTWPVVPAMLAVSRVRFWPMVLATSLGIAPMTALDVFLGEKLSAYLFS